MISMEIPEINKVSFSEEKNQILQSACAFEDEISIIEINPNDSKRNHSKLASLQMQQKVTKMTWKEHSKFKEGILLIGTEDGCLIGIDVCKLKENFELEENEEDNPYIFSFEIYENLPVTCFQYNFFKEDLLATGSKDLYIINFENSQQNYESPDIFCLYESPSIINNITSIAWNKSKSVEHILACASDNGKINIMDLKIKKCIFSFSDEKENENQREISLVWNQNFPTQIAVAFDNETSGVQLWDLKQPKEFIKKINNVGEAFYIDWNISEQGENEILICNREKQLIIYNMAKDCVEHTFKSDAQITEGFEIPNLCSTYATIDEHNNFKLISENEQELKEKAFLTLSKEKEEEFFSSILPSGKVMCVFNQKEIEQKTIQNSAYEIFSECHQKYEKYFNLIELILNNKNQEEIYSELKEEIEHDSEILLLLNHIDESPEQKQALLSIDEVQLMEKTEQITGQKYIDDSKVNQTQTQKQNTNLVNEVEETDAQDFFNNLGNSNDEDNSENLQEKDLEDFGLVENGYIQKTIKLNTNWSQGNELLIKQNILINNLQGAIDVCIHEERYTEALLIAKSHPTDSQKLIEFILKKFQENSEENFVKDFLFPLSMKNYKEIINNYEGKDWKEVLYFIENNIKESETQKELEQNFIEKLKEKNELKFVTKISLFLNQHEEYKESLIQELQQEKSLVSQLELFVILIFYCMKTKEKIKGEFLNAFLLKISNILIDCGNVETAYELLTSYGDVSDLPIKNQEIKIQVYYSHLLTVKIEVEKASFKFLEIKKPTKNTTEIPEQNSEENEEQKIPEISSKNTNNFEAKASPLLKTNSLTNKIPEKSGLPEKPPMAPPIEKLEKPEENQEQINDKANSSFISQTSQMPKPNIAKPPVPKPPSINPITEQSEIYEEKTTPPPMTNQPEKPEEMPQETVTPPPPVKPQEISYNPEEVQTIKEFYLQAQEIIPEYFNSPEQEESVIQGLDILDQQIQQKSITVLQMEFCYGIVNEIMQSEFDEATEQIQKHLIGTDEKMQSILRSYESIINVLK